MTHISIHGVKAMDVESVLTVTEGIPLPYRVITLKMETDEGEVVVVMFPEDNGIDLMKTAQVEQVDQVEIDEPIPEENAMPVAENGHDPEVCPWCDEKGGHRVGFGSAWHQECWDKFQEEYSQIEDERGKRNTEMPVIREGEPLIHLGGHEAPREHRELDDTAWD